MNIKGKKVLIHGEDVTSSIKSIYEVFSGYQVCYLNTAISSFSTSDVEIIDVKPFDIGEYYFSSSNINGCIVDCGFLNLSFSVSERGCFFDKDDAIAIAKALGVTGEDLL